MEEKTTFKGISAYPGTVYGKVFRWKQSKRKREDRTDLSPDEIKEEIELLKKGLQKTEDDLADLVQKSKHNVELSEILESQIVFLNDPLFRARVFERIAQNNESAGLALETAVSSLYDEFQSIPDEFFRERADHLLDIGKRIESNLYPEKGAEPTKIPDDVILIAKEITPSEMIQLGKCRLRGIATDFGGKTGHTAIIARNYGIPTIVGLKNITSHVEDDDYILLDATRGILNRSPAIDEIKLAGIKSEIKKTIPLREISDGPKELKTKDGKKFTLRANIDSEEEVDTAFLQGADGIGLVRTEILFIRYIEFKPTEEEQFAVYKRILLKMVGRPVTFRVWDIGADKMENGYEEENPFLGNRGIRYLLRHPHFFKEQLRALLRASEFGTMRIMLPMITTRSEILQTKVLIGECLEELKNQGLVITKKIPLGIMVETPACALNLPFLGNHVDFYSIGTNDLLQYLLAVERNNHLVGDLYNPWQVVFLLLLKNIVDVANSQKKPISICGEIGSDPMFTAVLIGLGIRDLSSALPLMKEVAEKVTEISTWKAKLLAEQVITLAGEEKFEEIETLVLETKG
ncbi:phosphoenolpyruvate--protein phosphotransferase [Leptospira levettii]|uniref:phosphoenolpyruvate--protein phosphotransferase n=1 Tax=Leptospira levettii TaxID=2023178 RepID=UPI001083F700|nr:phosphoenolpyruvate--protein phosphotransferase [Leptospira levettii]TGM28065.1 phosphoenolpyruvate--protein phosphotransferase [Leptospira levettii]TGM43667.1 phosphoenolpyruvate--protein phosphotransferase [Leptospira levettii]